jgi:hypothetical protein
MELSVPKSKSNKYTEIALFSEGAALTVTDSALKDSMKAFATNPLSPND